MSTDEERQIWRAELADADGHLHRVRCCSTYEKIEGDLAEAAKTLTEMTKMEYRVVRWWIQ